jgi:hypothetical protein
MNAMARFPMVGRGLALLVALPVCLCAGFDAAVTAQQLEEAVKTAPEPPPQQPPANNWFNVSTPGIAALAKPDSFLQFAPPPNGVCCPGQKSGCFLRRVAAWATYCPKYRVCSCTSCCNSCQYKGVESYYLYFLNPKCVVGSGLRQTFGNECYRGCQSCAAGPAGGHP